MTQPRRPMRKVGDLLPGLASALGLEDLVLAYMEGPAPVAPASPGLGVLR